jgi:hypothetical protein
MRLERDIIISGVFFCEFEEDEGNRSKRKIVEGIVERK